MTSLYIDKQLVVLPETFTIDIIEENPFFTKNGKYTYDITLSLLDPVNAKIYNHLNRINRKGEIPQNRTAYLIVDNEVELNGTEAILEYTEDEVKIQLVSGNSELNFLIGGDLLLTELNLGNITLYPYTFDAQIRMTYPDVDWQYVPIYSSNENRVYNKAWFTLSETGEQVFSITAVERIAYQPFLCTIIRLLFKSLGYSMTENEIENSKYKTLFILNGIKTNEYAKMLPEWTVVDFLTEVEKLCNVLTLVDPITKKVQIVKNNDFYNDSSKRIVITDVLDEYSAKIDEDNQLLGKNVNLSYSLPSSDYYKYQKLNEDILDSAEHTTGNNWVEIQQQMDLLDTEIERARRIYINKETETQYIAKTAKSETDVERQYLNKINIFADAINNDRTSDSVQLKITPADMREYLMGLNTSLLYIHTYLQLPQISTSMEFGEAEEEGENGFSIEDAIETGISVERNTELQVAFYDGLLDIYYSTDESDFPVPVSFPMAYVDFLREFILRREAYTNSEGKTLRLSGNNGLYQNYKEGIEIDTSKEFTIHFTYTGKIDIRSIFIILNKKFVCKELNYAITPKGRDKIIEGVFYPVMQKLKSTFKFIYQRIGFLNVMRCISIGYQYGGMPGLIADA